jgi:hypothetical protein
MDYIGTVAQSKKAHISYEHYETRIVRDLRVRLVGYTYHQTQIISPYSIPCVGDLRILRDALVSGACHWVRLTAGEVTRHMADLASREAAGETVTKKRKERSDKGAVKGPRKKPGANDGVAEEGDGQSDDAGPQRGGRQLRSPRQQQRARKTGDPPRPGSHSFPQARSLSTIPMRRTIRCCR